MDAQWRGSSRRAAQEWLCSAPASRTADVTNVHAGSLRACGGCVRVRSSCEMCKPSSLVSRSSMDRPCGSCRLRRRVKLGIHIGYWGLGLSASDQLAASPSLTAQPPKESSAAEARSRGQKLRGSPPDREATRNFSNPKQPGRARADAPRGDSRGDLRARSESPRSSTTSPVRSACHPDRDGPTTDAIDVHVGNAPSPPASRRARRRAWSRSER